MAVTESEVHVAIVMLTLKGRYAMQAIGERRLSFFDNGIEQGSGSWGECLTGELGHRSSGVLGGLVKQRLLTSSQEDHGSWYELTELGAAVAKKLAAR
jgi:hypothetical protein